VSGVANSAAANAVKRKAMHLLVIQITSDFTRRTPRITRPAL